MSRQVACLHGGGALRTRRCARSLPTPPFSLLSDFGLEDLTLVESRAKTFMNALFKLEKAQLRVFAGLGTRYVLL